MNSNHNVETMTVADAARLMGVSQQFVRIGLQKGNLPIGTAVRISGKRFTYYISPIKFTEFTGIDLSKAVHVWLKT